MTAEVTTGEFRIGHAKLLALMARRYAVTAAWTGAALLAVSAVLGIFIDFRWLIVSLMLIFIVAPAMAAMLYFNYGMRPECFVNILDHRVTFSGNELVVTAYIREPQEEAEEEAVDSEESPDKEEVPRREVVYRFRCARPAKYEVGTKTLTIIPAAPAKGFIIVPFDAFEEKEEAARVLAALKDIK